MTTVENTVENEASDQISENERVPVEHGPTPALAPTPASVPAPAPAPVPVVAPYIGLVAAVLCALGGGWLLLAPYALDFRHGAAHVPRAMTVDLESGAAIVAVAIATAVLFSLTLIHRLHVDLPLELEAELDSENAPVSAPEREAKREPESEPVPTAVPKEADPGGALRDLLTPLVAALAADLRSHDPASHDPRSRDQSTRERSSRDQEREPRRQEH